MHLHYLEDFGASVDGTNILFLCFFFQISKFDAEKVAQLTTFLVDFLEYIRASQGDQLDHKKVRVLQL